MPEELGMKYIAVRDIHHNGTLAYGAGQLVHFSAVEGDAGWLTVGPDVAVREGARLDKPLPGSPHAVWVGYAVQEGADPAVADAASLADLEAAFGGDEIKPLHAAAHGRRRAPAGKGDGDGAD